MPVDLWILMPFGYNSPLCSELPTGSTGGYGYDDCCDRYRGDPIRLRGGAGLFD